MKTLRYGFALALVLLHPLLITAQINTSTGRGNPLSLIQMLHDLPFIPFVRSSPTPSSIPSNVVTSYLTSNSLVALPGITVPPFPATTLLSTGTEVQPSASAQISSASKTQSLSTFQTSFRSSSNDPPETPRPIQPSTRKSSPAIPKPSSSPPPRPEPKAPTKALSVIFRKTWGRGEDYNTWTFFETKPNTQADGCGVPVLNDLSRKWYAPFNILVPPWPHGTFMMPLFGEKNCKYQSDGTNPGILHCPSMGEGKTVGCKAAAEKDNIKDITDCHSPGLKTNVHRIVYCEW